MASLEVCLDLERPLIVLLDADLSEDAGTDFFASGDVAVSSFQWSAAAGEH
ncbi:hypothetical protein GFB56_07010 [Ensifer sp. T173]|uniref:Uncharacterized protein n=1 Tax=Ensifer canadensis TaxID=555315 RepID=A0AAW4FHS2_9HYPH|nr:hypothetical protein [Ensifer canadensis]MBM3090561.1 hypothetical protein [Ensifer canadensis]UBI80811.1 hypothetical protein J3R84_34770 [Ensifer canadensis]